MENAGDFHFLNKDYFDSEPQDKNMIMAKQLKTLLTHQAWRNDANAAIEHLAMSISCYKHEAFVDQVCIFIKLLQLQPKDKNNNSDNIKKIRKLQAYFQEFEIEEWCLQLYESYFWYCCQGSDYINDILQKGLFQKNVTVFTKERCKQFCRKKRDFQQDEAHRQLEELFKLLKMNRIHSRRTKEAFIQTILPTIETILSKKAFYYLDYCLKEDQQEWNGYWYILDIGLFAYDLLKHYEDNMQISLQQSSQDEKVAHVEFAFVLTLLYLTSGQLIDWTSIEEIPFAENVQTIHHFHKSKKV